MFDVLSQAKNAMESYTIKLKTISNNITNVEVNGFKRSDVNFQTMYSKLISSGTAAFSGNSIEGGTNPLQIGGTVTISDTTIDFTNGEATEGKQLDVALSIPGAMFVLSPDGGNTFKYTRNGHFQIVNDKVVNSAGMQLYAFKLYNGIPSQKLEPVDLTGFSYTEALMSWDEYGYLRSYNPETKEYGEVFPYQLGFVIFKNPGALKYEDATTFSETPSSGPPSDPLLPRYGIINPRKLEKSNVVYSTEVIDSIEVQRSLDSVMSVIKMANDTITAFINKLG